MRLPDVDHLGHNQVVRAIVPAVGNPRAISLSLSLSLSLSIHALYEIVWAGDENKGCAWTPRDSFQQRNARTPLTAWQPEGPASDNRKGK